MIYEHVASSRFKHGLVELRQQKINDCTNDLKKNNFTMFFLWILSLFIFSGYYKTTITQIVKKKIFFLIKLVNII